MSQVNSAGHISAEDEKGRGDGEERGRRRKVKGEEGGRKRRGGGVKGEEGGRHWKGERGRGRKT